MNYTRIASTVIIGIIGIISVGAIAHAESAPAPATDLTQGGTVSCFDYYHFGSVQAHLTPSVTTTVSGTPISFTGKLTNANPYPVVNGSLYVKVFKLRKNATEKNVNGPYVVDQFFVKDNVTIPANGSIPLNFNWNVPSYAASGDYQIATFFTSAHKYNLLGLSFTDDVVGNTANFKVAAEQEGSVSLDKDTVTINAAPYHFAAFPPHVSATSSATIVATVVNATSKDEVVPVNWRVYSWDAQQQSNQLATQDTTVTVKAHSSAKVTYQVTDTSTSVYLVQAMTTYHDTKSFLNIRFVRDGVDRLRINFPSLMQFPLDKDKPATLFSCFHNTADNAPNGKLSLAIYDDAHNELAQYTYSGNISGNMQAVAKQFTPKKNYDHVTLEATLWQGDKQVDTETVRYDCDAIDQSSCRPVEKSSPMMLIIAGGALLVVIAGGAALFLVKRRK